MKQEFHEEAELEFNEAISFYENQREGLGLEFAEEVHSTLSLILKYPDAWTKVSADCRRCLVKRFPYGVIYSIEKDCIFIIAIMALNRKPDYWKERSG